MMLEATVIPLSSLPTAHPSPEAVNRRPAIVRRPELHTGGRFTRAAAQVTTRAVAQRSR